MASPSLSTSPNVDELTNAFRRIGAACGDVDVLFANAGTVRYVAIEDATEQVFDHIFATNVKSVFFTVQRSLSLLRRGASVVLNGSVAHVTGSPGGTIYGATKASVSLRA